MFNSDLLIIESDHEDQVLGLTNVNHQDNRLCAA